LIDTMRPEYNYWFSQMEHFAEVAVRTTAAEDLFVSLAWTSFKPGDETATFRALVNPLVVWMWTGGGFILLGGIIAFWPDRGRGTGRGMAPTGRGAPAAPNNGLHRLQSWSEEDE